jgi:flagellar basal-body rod protein FlgB
MAVTDLPIFGMLRTKMAWHQERQRVLAENVANADTPRFRPSDLEPPTFDRRPQTSGLSLARTASGHIAVTASESTGFRNARNSGYDVRPSGNAVSLEDEMMKVSSNQMDYQAATSLYSKSIGLLKTAVGKR